MRVKFIKLRNRVNEIKAQLQKLEFIDENFRISDYEALKVKSRFYVNHLEEREEELNKWLNMNLRGNNYLLLFFRLRVVCQNSIQILAHFKEKAVASEADLSQLAYELQIVTLEIMQVGGTLYTDWLIEREIAEERNPKLDETEAGPHQIRHQQFNQRIQFTDRTRPARRHGAQRGRTARTEGPIGKSDGRNQSEEGTGAQHPEAHREHHRGEEGSTAQHVRCGQKENYGEIGEKDECHKTSGHKLRSLQ